MKPQWQHTLHIGNGQTLTIQVRGYVDFQSRFGSWREIKRDFAAELLYMWRNNIQGYKLTRERIG